MIKKFKMILFFNTLKFMAKRSSNWFPELSSILYAIMGSIRMNRLHEWSKIVNEYSKKIVEEYSQYSNLRVH